MEFDKAKLKDYGTSLLFFGVAAVVAYQPQVMAYIPAEYSLLALIGFGILSQIAADSRVKGRVHEVNAVVDEKQEELEEALAKLDELQAKIEPENAA